MGKKNQFIDHHTVTEHLSPHTYSKQLYKGILADRSKAVFNGRVFIAEGAKGSRSEQLNKNLLLSKKAEINTKPELQIYNDDVKATHGATVGQLDLEQLFYLQSRGISRKEAWNILCRGFSLDFIDELNELDLDAFHQSMIREIDGLGDEN